jgi:signal transduction histidine kinase
MTFRWRLWALPYFVAAAVAAGMLLLVQTRGRGATRNSLMLMLASVGTTLTTTGLVFVAGDEETATFLVHLSQAMAVFVAPVALEFASALTSRPLNFLRRAAWMVAIVNFFLSWTDLVISGARAYPYGFAGRAGPLYPVVLGGMAMANSLPVLLWLHLPEERRPLERRQLQLVMLASLFGGVAFIDTLPLMGIDAPPFSWAPLLIASGTLLTAIVRHRLLDIRLTLRRTFTWTALTVIGSLPFAAAAAVMAPRLAHGRPLPLALLFAGLVVGMRAYLTGVQPIIDTFFGRRTQDIEDELVRLANQAATLKTSEELGRAIDRFLAALDRRLAALVVIDERGRPRVALSAWGSVPPPARNSALLSELAHVKGIISRDHQGPAQVEIERACIRWAAEYLGPLVTTEGGGQLLGLIAVSARQGGGVSDAVELEALERMCVTVTAALAGARLYQQLHGLSIELEQKALARSESLAKTLRDLRGAEQRLVQSEKLASLGQIVAGVAADLTDQVRTSFETVLRLRSDAEVMFHAADQVRAALPSAADPRFEDIARDVGPLLDAVSEGARRALAIAQDLSGFASAEFPIIDGEVSAPRRRPAHLAALIDSTLTLVTGHLNDVAVVRDYDETLPAVPVETGPLGQVILNLILNATQAMKGSGTLTLSTRQLDGQAELAVADTGPGIPAEVLPRIFEPFFSTKGPTVGTGLGLSISYGIVRRHGGRILVDSTVGQGTTFRVQIPLRAEAA